MGIRVARDLLRSVSPFQEAYDVQRIESVVLYRWAASTDTSGRNDVLTEREILVWLTTKILSLVSA